MPIFDVQHLTPAQYARHRGCSRQAVDQALKAGRITADADGRIDPVAADAQWAARSRPRVRSSAPPPGTPDRADSPAAGTGQDTYLDARRREALARATLAELEVATQARALVSVAEVRASCAAHLSACRDILLGLAARLAPVLAAETDASRVHLLLESEHRRALQEMARVDTDLDHGAGER